MIKLNINEIKIKDQGKQENLEKFIDNDDPFMNMDYEELLDLGYIEDRNDDNKNHI